MIYIPNDNHDPALNLAMEEYILSASGIEEPVLFFYINDPSVIIGRHQNTLDEINKDFTEKNGIKVVRRCSGGGAVYHDRGNLNYSLIRPGDQKASGDFSILLQPILEALHKMGLPAELGGRNDLLINGSKFSGNAYYHNRFGSVTHGTLLYDSDLKVLSQALKPDPHKLQSKGISSVRSRVCCIKNALPELKNIEELRSAIICHFSDQDNFSTRNFDIYDIQKIETIANSRYRSDLWNIGKSPAYTIRLLTRQSSGQIDFRADVRQDSVNNVRFFGDFFCSDEISELENKLRGIHWDSQSISNAFKSADWEKFFPEYPLNTFISQLFSMTTDA